MDKIFDLIPVDKILHFSAGFIVTTVVSSFAPIIIGVTAGTLVGLGKELIDKYRGGTFDKADFLCTFAGSFSAMAVLVPFIHRVTYGG